MNRCVDCRSDLYALGINLYEMLTGNLLSRRPIRSSGPTVLLRKPVARSEQFETIAPAVCALIMKLLAKTAEER